MSEDPSMNSMPTVMPPAVGAGAIPEQAASPNRDNNAKTAAAVSDLRPKFPRDHAGFQAELRRRVDAWFHQTGRPQRDCWQMYLKTAIVLAWFAAAYVLLVFFAQTWWQALPLAIMDDEQSMGGSPGAFDGRFRPQEPRSRLAARRAEFPDRTSSVPANLPHQLPRDFHDPRGDLPRIWGEILRSRDVPGRIAVALLPLAAGEWGDPVI